MIEIDYFTEEEISALRVVKEDYSIYLILDDGGKATVTELKDAHTQGRVRISYEVDDESYERLCSQQSELGRSVIDVMMLIDHEISSGSSPSKDPYPDRFLDADKITELRGYVTLWVHERDNLYHKLVTRWDSFGTCFSIARELTPKSLKDIELSLRNTIKTIEEDSFSVEMLNVEREKDLATNYLKEFVYDKL